MDFHYTYAGGNSSSTTDHYDEGTNKCLSLSSVPNGSAVQVIMQVVGGVSKNCGNPFDESTLSSASRNYTATGTSLLPNCTLN